MRPVDERILHTRHEHTFMTIAAVYAPPKDHDLEDKENFNHNVKWVVGRYPTGTISLRKLAVTMQDQNRVSAFDY